MKTLTIICAVAAAAAPAGPALAENWQLASETASASVYIDMDSVERTGGRVRFWHQLRHREVMSLSSGLQWDRDNLSTEADCAAMTYVHRETVARLRGKIVLNYRGGEPGVARPGSLIALLIEKACAAGAEPATAI